ncbi:PspC domain-containing protein [Virgibacillus siamensis]|uniref:PspC domain-containing protein n=1 Tax=Virgibacillus siamensis TaxID=480071 RepID=UPI000986E4D1|nr:PspC domain-containing protein [Virgibacillus siamensis]
MSKRLYRSESNRMLAGVCSGIAEYFNIDATIVRLLFAVSVLFGAFGVFVYIVCIFVVPNEREVR